MLIFRHTGQIIGCGIVAVPSWIYFMKRRLLFSPLPKNAHNIGQICAAMLVLGGTAVLGYLPALLGVSLVTGSLTGFVTSLLFRAMGSINFTQ